MADEDRGADGRRTSRGFFLVKVKVVEDSRSRWRLRRWWQKGIKKWNRSMQESDRVSGIWVSIIHYESQTVERN